MTAGAASTEFQQDLAARALLLAATGLGLPSAPMNGWDETEVKRVIGIDDRDDLAIALLISVGYPAGRVAHPGRRPLDRTVFRNRYGAPWQTT